MRFTTTLGCSRMSQFGKRSTVQPRSVSQWSRDTSRAGVGKWGAPSASRTSAASTQKKSTMNRPSGCCLRNFTPQSARSRSSFHRARSAGVAARRSNRDRYVGSRSNRGISFYRHERRRSCVKSVLPSPFGTLISFRPRIRRVGASTEAVDPAPEPSPPAPLPKGEGRRTGAKLPPLPSGEGDRGGEGTTVQAVEM